MRVLLFFSALVSLACAIQFTTPSSNTTVVKNSYVTLNWTSVNTDPSEFSIYLWNFANWPPYYMPLQYHVNTAAGSANVRIPCTAATSGGFQLNAINGTNVYIIYAQSPTFGVAGGPCQDPAPITCGSV